MRNFGDERADGETKKEEREENRNNVLMREKLRGKHASKILLFFLQYYVQCNSMFKIVL